MNRKLEKKIVFKGKFQDVLQEDDQLYLMHKLDKICVLPYTLAEGGLLDRIGVIKERDIEKEKDQYSLLNGFINADDGTNLVAANRILFEVIGSNVTKADNWMYLGTLDNISLGSNIRIYAVNLTDVEINTAEEVEETKKALKFDMIPSNKVAGSDDALFLAAYLRLFNYFYVQNLTK
jgi:hypothetical protein